MRGRFPKLILISLSLACVIALLVYLYIRPGYASPTSAWLDAADPTLQKEAELPQGVLPPFAINGNRDCTDRYFVTRPKKILPVWPFVQSENGFTACAVETILGPMELNGYLQFNNSQVAGKTIRYNAVNPDIIPVPNSTTVIHYTTASPIGLYLFFTKNAASAITPEVKQNSEVTYRFNRLYDVALKDKANNLLPAHIDSLSFSANGKWMIVDSPNRAIIRVNLETFEVLPFAPTATYNNGNNPGLQTAISSDGRYAVVASNGLSTFRIYDLSTCTNIPIASIAGPASCQSRSFVNFMSQKVPGIVGVSQLRFTGAYTLSLYAGFKIGTSPLKNAKFTLAAPGQAIQKSEYLALGDSFASGEGAYLYRDGTDSDNNKCHLSLRSYPYLLADSLNFNNARSVACSGAIMNDITNGEESYVGQVKDGKPRRERNEDDIFKNFTPGYINQLDFVKKYQPRIITISAVGNDIGFGDKLKRCVGLGTCFSTYEDRLEIMREINSKFDNLVSMYSKVKNATVPNAKVYVLGYPKIIKPGGNCGANVLLNNDEAVFADQLTIYLNSVIKKAADATGTTYINVENALLGHRLCEGIYSNLAVNGLTAGDDLNFLFFNGPFGKESYHPNAMGHQLLAAAIRKATQDFGLSMPNTSPVRPTEDLDSELLNASPSGRPVRNTVYKDSLADNILYRQRTINLSLDSGTEDLRPLTQYHVWLNPNHTDLGTISTDDTGNLNAQVVIPDTIPTGFHTLHVEGLNMAGETIDMYKTSYVAANDIDLDGDSIPNTNDPCIVFMPSGQDEDQDGTDDACDSFISKPPMFLSKLNATNLLQASAADVVLASTTYSELDVASSTSTPSGGSVLADSTLPEDRIQIPDKPGPLVEGKQGSYLQYIIMALLFIPILVALWKILSSNKK